jgi:hypothetical protein
MAAPRGPTREGLRARSPRHLRYSPSPTAVRAPSLALFTLSLVALFSLLPGRAQADSPFEGKWTEGPLKEEYTVLKWQKECEAAPVNGSSGGGETVSVHSEGDELSFIGGGRVFRTNQCYDQMPTLSRESHTRSPSGREWRTRCTTPPSDPRRAVMNTLVIATSDTHIDIVETGRYESQLVGGLCTADIKRSRSFDLVAHDTPTPTPTAVATAPPTKPVAPEPASNGTDSNRCASPGDPTRLEARPSRKLLRTGETFGFRGLVLDASGCVTRTPTTWTVDEHASKALSVDSSGRVTVATDAPEGSFEVVVSAAGKSTRVTVDVASPARYDALLQQSGLNDAGENDAASVVVIAASQIGGSDARAEDGSKRRRSIFLFIVGVLAVVLAAVAVIASRRTKRAAALEREAQERYAEKVEAAEARKREKTAQHTAAMRAHELSVEEAKRVEAENVAAAGARPGMVCPACQREYSPGSAFCPNDANRLVPLNISPNPLSSPPGPSGSICPTCKRGYDPGVKVCPHDKDDLVPYAQYASRQPDAAPLAPRGKICPTCGNRFEGPVEFCGKDGTALVLLN